MTNPIEVSGSRSNANEQKDVAKAIGRSGTQTKLERACFVQLGGRLPADMVELHNISACPPAKLPTNRRDINAKLQVLLAAEQCAEGYTNILRHDLRQGSSNL